MKVSDVSAALTGEDLLGILKDFVQVEGLHFEKVEITQYISVYGSYKKGVSIPFHADIGLGNVNENIINVKIFKINAAKINIFKGITDLALKTFLKDFSEYGIKANKDTLSIDLNLISKLIPYVYFKLNSVIIENGTIKVSVSDIIYASDKKTETIGKKAHDKPQMKEKDKYYNLRKNIDGKVPEKYRKIVEYAMFIPDITALLWRLYRDKRVHLSVKIKAIAVIGYIASPIDIIPDFIPFIGQIDDVAIAFFGINAIFNEVPENIILENWQGEKNIILIVRQAVKYISEAVGSRNVGKIIDFVKKIFAGSDKKKENTDETC